MEQIFKQDYDFEPIPLRKFKALIETMENNGATHMKIGYYQDDYPYVIFGKEEVEYILGDNTINGVELNEKIQQEELHEYYIVDREDFINELIRWISEANKDKELMKSDLKMLMDIDDEYILSSNSTNSYLYPGIDGYEDACKELLEINKKL